MALDRPIFIVGSGRCGSTLYHNLFVHHSRVAFLTGLCLKYPHRPQLNRWAMHLLDVPLLSRFARRHFRPAEHWPFWEAHCRGFSVPCRDLLASDVRPPVKARLARVLGQMVTPRRRRLVVKLSGWPRIGFLSEIFPDALFIHLVRDGRAVANSLLSTDFWLGYQGPNQWQWGDLTVEQQRLWEASGRSFVTLAGIQWARVMDAFEKAREVVPASQYMEISYDDLVANPKSTFARALSFCRLDYSRDLEAAIDAEGVDDRNYKWKEHLTREQQHQLEVMLGDHLKRWGFPVRRQTRYRNVSSNLPPHPADQCSGIDRFHLSELNRETDGSNSELDQYCPV
jgi:hypothetical protein